MVATKGETKGDVGPGWVPQPRVAVAVTHRAMRALIVDLLARQQPEWHVSAVDGVASLGAEPAWPPDIAVIDAAAMSRCGDGRLGGLPVEHLVVIGPEPDPFYRQAILDRGAGAWVSRDDVSEALGPAIGIVLGRSPPDLLRATHGQPVPWGPPSTIEGAPSMTEFRIGFLRLAPSPPTPTTLRYKSVTGL